MANVNSAYIIGRLGKDPELRNTAGGNPVLNFTVATTDYYTDKSGNKKEQTEWHNVCVFGKAAESLTKILSKGSQVFVDGRITYKEYEAKDGSRKQKTEIVARNVQVLSEKKAPTDTAAEKLGLDDKGSIPW